jgi:hypothetical protein
MERARLTVRIRSKLTEAQHQELERSGEAQFKALFDIPNERDEGTAEQSIGSRAPNE